MDEKNKKKSWYAYIHGHPFDTSSYFKTNVQPEFGIGKTIAAIYARGNDTHPEELSIKLKMLIADALTSGISQPRHPKETIVFMK